MRVALNDINFEMPTMYTVYILSISSNISVCIFFIFQLWIVRAPIVLICEISYHIQLH